MVEELDPKQQHFLEFALSLIPVFHTERGEKNEPNHIATATFVAFGPHALLVTAGHVWDWRKSGHLLVPGQNGLFVLPDTVFSSGFPGMNRDKDRIDFAHFYLTRPQVTSLISRGFRPFQLAKRVLDDAGNPSKKYSFAGFPEQLNVGASDDGRFGAFILSGRLLRPKDYQALELDYKAHIAIRYSQKKVQHIKEEVKKPWTPPKPNGMSGGGVWRHAVHPVDRSLVRPELVGIIIEHKHRKNLRAIVAARLEFVVASIWDAYPFTEQFLPQLKNHDITMIRPMRFSVQKMKGGLHGL